MRRKRNEVSASDESAPAAGVDAGAGARSRDDLRRRVQVLEAAVAARTSERDQVRQELDAFLENKRAGDETFRQFSESGLVSGFWNSPGVLYTRTMPCSG